MFRTAVPQDFEGLAALEAEAFGDGEAFCRLAFEKFAGWKNIFLCEDAGQLAAMALAVPVTLAGRQGGYLYALATRQALRGTGLMSGLLAHIRTQAVERGWDFLCLIPAGAAQAAFYAKRGFAPAFYRYAYQMDIPRNLLAVAEFDDVTVSALPQLRRRFCRRGDVQLSQQSLVAVLTDYYSAGGCSVRTAQGYGFFRQEDGWLYFDEFFATDEAAARQLLQASREKTGCQRARILAAEEMDFLGHGRRVDHGMLCPLTPQAPAAGYMGMMLDV